MSSFEDPPSKARKSSVLVEALCDVVQQHHEDHDILDLMTLVHQRVGTDASKAHTKTKQKTEIRFTLTKFLKL